MSVNVVVEGSSDLSTSLKWYYANKERHSKTVRAWRKANPDKVHIYERRRKMMRAYGITLEEYDALLEAQDFKCALCHTNTPKGRGRFHVDHCHKTGRIRGLLCHRCNTCIGGFEDDPSLLARAIEYLQ